MQLTPEQQQFIDTRYPGCTPGEVLRWRVVRALAEAGGSLPVVDLEHDLGIAPGSIRALLSSTCDLIESCGNVRLGVYLAEQLGLAPTAWRLRSPAELQAIFARCRNARLIMPCEVGE